MFDNFSVKKFFVGISLVLLVVMSLNIITNYKVLDDMRLKIFEKEQKLLPNAFSFLNLKINVIQVQQWLTDVSATRAHEGFDDGFTEAKNYFNEANIILDKLIQENKKANHIQMAQNLEDFKIDFQKYYDVGVKMAQTYVEYGPEEGNKMMLVLDPFAEKLADQLEVWVKKYGDKNLELSEELKSSITFIEYQAIIFGIVTILIMLISLMLLGKRIITNLQILQDGILGFFKFVNKETATAKSIEITTKDEFGKMAGVVNENIIKTEKTIKADLKFLDEVKLMVDEVNKGYLFKRLENKAESESLELFRQNFNNMLENLNGIVGGSTNKILNVLESYAQLDFTNGIRNDNGKIPLTLNNVNKLITEMLVENKSIGLTLEASSKILIKNVNLLNTNSTEAAAALEETAAALEEITSNISNNTDNIVLMAGNAAELTDSVNVGEKLAGETTKAMDEINDEVNAINEAISVIDQIAFQTNILSLNAAVEAATAGEAGKGFAVVAQEVRNLAARSAEAANEIKTLVENANNKANSGKNIADKMREGYNNLNNSISKTITIIADVESASKEQLKGIEQINNAISALDQQTQENANIASQTNSIALQTDDIAHIIVKNADEKEFTGKDEVKAKDLNIA